jgi:hypothetical protein
MNRKIILILALGLLGVRSFCAAETIRRFVLAAGVNNGGVERELLRYAVGDAENFTRVLTDMGGVDPADCILLRNPDLEAFEQGLEDLRRRVSAAARWGGGRLEVLVYYSGHADEKGLLIGGERETYWDLRRELEGISADVHIAVLDACASGTITRIKGGRKTRPFLVDESSNMRGYAFLTSSSEDEAAQESDRIRASFFTHYLVSGMRGAADATGDGRVTLDEAYQFAHDETLARTTGTRGGTQHPHRDIKMNGAGDVVMTDLRQISAGLVLSGELSGRFFVRNAEQQLVAELYKPEGKGVELGLEPGDYSIHLEADPQLLLSVCELQEGQRLELGRQDFHSVDKEQTVLRGGARKKKVRVGLSENFNLDIETRQGYTFSLGLFFNYQDKPFRGAQGAWLVNQAREMAGSQVSFFGNLAQKDQRGWQASGMVNWTVGALQGGQVGGAINIGRQVRGWQISGSTNIAKRIRGWQIAGGANIAKEVKGVQISPFNAAAYVDGWQIGAVNISEDIDGVPLGIFNYSHTGLFNIGFWRDEIGFNYLTLASGSRTFYTSFSIGHEFPVDEGVLALGFGVGGHRNGRGMFFENDLNVYGFISDVEEPERGNWLFRQRLLVGRKLDAGMDLFAGLSLNLLYLDGEPALVQPWGGGVHEFDDDWRGWPGLFAGLRFGR